MIPEYMYQLWNVRQSTPSMGLIVTFLQFYLKLNILFVRYIQK